jgi:hypothetical protein
MLALPGQIGPWLIPLVPGVADTLGADLLSRRARTAACPAHQWQAQVIGSDPVHLTEWELDLGAMDSGAPADLPQAATS